MVKCPDCGCEFVVVLQCHRCSHKWYPKTPNMPKVCPNPKCKSPYWDRPRRKRKGKRTR